MNKKNMIKIISGLVIIVVVIAGIYIQKYGNESVVSYNKFIEQLNEDKIDSVTLNQDESILYLIKGDETVYKTDNPRTLDFKEELLLKGVKVSEGGGSVSSVMLIQNLLGISFMGVLFFALFSNLKKSGQLKGAKSSYNAIEATELKTDFSNIAGNVEVKEQVEDVIDFMKNPNQYVDMGARMPKGLILYGPPGTGKTLMAKAIAKESGVAFFSVSGSDFVQMYVGVGASRVREIFKEARKHNKAVIFIDEIDAIGKKRSQNAANSNDEKDQTLNALLTEMSGFKEDEGIIVIAATNRLDMLDDALLRPGRFDRHIEVGYPDLSARESIIRLHVKNKPISDSVSISELAKQTVFFTGAMLENLLNEAAIKAAVDGEQIINNTHIESAFYTIIAGKEKKDRTNINELERKITAYHEAGHALITKIVAPENNVTKVTIIPSTKGIGGFSMNIPKDKAYLSKKEIIARIQISLAGRVAEEIIFGKDNITTGASNDIEKATTDLKNYISKYGMDSELGLVNMEVIMGNNEYSNKYILDKCQTKMKEIYDETKLIMTNNIDKLEALASALLEKETLNEKEIASFFI